MYRSNQEVIQFIPEHILFRESVTEQSAKLWIKGIDDSFYLHGEFILYSTIIESISKTLFSLKVSFKFLNGQQIFGIVGTSREESVRKLWEAECFECMTREVTENQKLPPSTFYKMSEIPSYPVPPYNLKYDDFRHLTFNHKQLEYFKKTEESI